MKTEWARQAVRQLNQIVQEGHELAEAWERPQWMVVFDQPKNTHPYESFLDWREPTQILPTGAQVVGIWCSASGWAWISQPYILAYDLAAEGRSHRCPTDGR